MVHMQRAWATSVKRHGSVQRPLLHLSPACLYGRERTAAKILPGRLRKGYSLPNLVKPSTFAYREGAASQRYLSCYGKTIHVNTSPFQLSTFSALQSDSKNNLLLSELLCALMHRADAPIGAKDEDYSRGANFEHIRTHIAKEMPISLQSNYITRVLSSLQFSHSQQQ